MCVTQAGEEGGGGVGQLHTHTIWTINATYGTDGMCVYVCVRLCVSRAQLSGAQDTDTITHTHKQ